jgi:hypothetical protein
MKLLIVVPNMGKACYIRCLYRGIMNLATSPFEHFTQLLDSAKSLKRFREKKLFSILRFVTITKIPPLNCLNFS